MDKLLHTAPEFSPDQGFRREAETSIDSMFFGCIRVTQYSLLLNATDSSPDITPAVKSRSTVARN